MRIGDKQTDILNSRDIKGYGERISSIRTYCTLPEIIKVISMKVIFGSDCDKLVCAIKEYKRLHGTHDREQSYLADLLC